MVVGHLSNREAEVTQYNGKTDMQMLEMIANQVKDWWEEHKYDCCGSWNVYDEDPSFVKSAKLAIGDWERFEEWVS